MTHPRIPRRSCPSACSEMTELLQPGVVRQSDRCGLAARKSHRKRRSPPRAALHLDRATMRFGDPFTDGETEPGPRTLTRTRARRIGTPETIEHMRQIAGRDADARVRDREHRAAIVAAQLDRDLTAARRVFDRILNEIQRELAHAAAVHR